MSPLVLLRALTRHTGRQRPAGPYIQREPHRGQVLRPRKVRERRLQVEIMHDQHQGTRGSWGPSDPLRSSFVLSKSLERVSQLKIPKIKNAAWHTDMSSALPLLTPVPRLKSPLRRPARQPPSPDRLG